MTHFGSVSPASNLSLRASERQNIGVLVDQLVCLEIVRIGDSEDAYGRTLAYVYLDTNGDGHYEHLYNEDLIELRLARTTTFSREHLREVERLREEAEERGAGLWSACPRADNSN